MRKKFLIYCFYLHNPYYMSFGIERWCWDEIVQRAAQRLIKEGTTVFCTYNGEPISFRGGREHLSTGFYENLNSKNAIEPFENISKLMKESEEKIPLKY